MNDFRGSDLLRITAIACLLATGASAQSFNPVGQVSGPASVVDGDGLRLAGYEIRLRGIASPEWNDPGGSEATAALRQAVSGQTVTCYFDGTTTYDRHVAECYVGDQDVARTVIRGGWALDCPRYSGGIYRAAEDAAASDGAMIRRIYRRPGYCTQR